MNQLFDLLAEYLREVYFSMKALLLILLTTICVMNTPIQANDTLSQFSTVDALIQGIYSGPTTFAEVSKHGDFGLGTVNDLDGEMLLLDGVCYQVTSDGKVHILPATAQTPFAVVAFFHPEQSSSTPPEKSLAELEQWLEQHLGSQNYFSAIRITGTFPMMKVRSVARQQRPYPSLASIVETQAIFDLKDVQGTLIGFRSPPFAAGINVPGYHFHFLTDDKQQGGHVLDCSISSAKASWEHLEKFSVELPNDPAFAKADLSHHDAAMLKKVEQK